ncbi:hypothetical protein ONE63_005626 [Megalurothrips usitatus]|uniref:Uncharacterized protein n=1 Tax=Megalurothrips usitatus TaxID=439358 RepID=A0AAV7Y2D7_9NEOP|nr:hypothetical protein ONE63_005626 [Megalurothrips usitatus]
MPLAGLRGGASRLANLALRATDGLHHVGPGAYSAASCGALYETLNKVTSTRGVGPGARTALRFRDLDQHLPAPNTYQTVCRAPPSPSKVPFNTASFRKPLAVSNTPGPGSYSPGAFSLPGVPVAVRCGAGEGPGRCEGCLQELAPGVEFWACDQPVQGLPRGSVMCQACMLRARKTLPGQLARFSRWQLDAFKKCRDCSDIHRHEGTRAKILLVDPKTVAKRRRKEAYLSKYFRDLLVRGPDLVAGTEPATLTEAELQVYRAPAPDFCCLHEAFNSFNRDRMSFGLRASLPSGLFYNTYKRCALDFDPSSTSSGYSRPPADGPDASPTSSRTAAATSGILAETRAASMDERSLRQRRSPDEGGSLRRSLSSV